MKKLVLLFFVLFLFSCDKDAEENAIPFTGFYKISSMTADQPIDINNDGLASTNLMEEMELYFNNTAPDLEIRPHEFTESNALLIAFSFPDQFSVGGYPEYTSGYFDFNKSTLGSSFKFIDDEIILETNSIEEIAVVLQTVTYRNDIVEAAYTKAYYDFKTDEWEELNITVVYVKMDL